jgi:hypothetical protein
VQAYRTCTAKPKEVLQVDPTMYDKARIDDMIDAPCPKCLGVGEIAWLPMYTTGSSMNHPDTRIDSCPECDGTGTVVEYRWEYDA